MWPDVGYRWLPTWLPQLFAAVELKRLLGDRIADDDLPPLRGGNSRQPGPQLSDQTNEGQAAARQDSALARNRAEEPFLP